MVDEMCIIVMERNNTEYSKNYKRKEAEKEKKKAFDSEMSKLFERDAGEVW